MKTKVLILLFFISITSLYANPQELQKTTIQLAWKHQWQFAGYYMAKEKGFYKEAGLDVDIKEFGVGVNVTKDVTSRKVDFGVGRSSLIYDRSEKKPVVMLASILQHSPIIILTKKRDDIQKVEDLKNKKIMLTQDQVGMASINAMFYSKGIKSDDYIFQQHSFNVQDLIDDKTDGLLAYISNEPYQMKKQGIEYTVFSPKEYNFDFLSDILFTSDTLLKEKPELVRKFREATIQGWIYAIENQEETTKLIIEKYNSQNKTKDALEFEAQEIVKLADYPNVPLGQIDQDRVEYITQIYRLMGLITGDVSYDSLVYKVKDNNIINLTKKEQEWLNKKRTLNYVYDVNWAPFEWENDFGEHTGIIYDILKLIEKSSGIKFEKISTESWKEAVSLMENGGAEMFSGVGETPDRKKYLNFTKNSIFKTPYVFVSKENDKNNYLETFKAIQNKKVAVLENSTIHGILKENIPILPLLTIETVEAGFKKVRDGSFDIFIVNAPSAKYFINRKGYDDLKIATKTEFNLELKIALQKNIAPEAISILDKAIGLITQEQLADIYFKWTEVQVKETIDWELILEISGIALLIIIGFIYWNRTMAREITKRKEAELKLIDQKLLFEKLFNAAPDAITLLRGDGTFADCNDAALKVFGVETKDNFLKLSPDQLSPELQPNGIKSEDAVKLKIQEAFKEGKTSFEWFHTRPTNQQNFYADVVLAPFTYENKPLIYAIVRDITTRKEAQKKINQANKEIAENHKKIHDSIQYASLIQNALIPKSEVFEKYFQDSFTIWNPKDIVGGDIYLCEELRDNNELLLMVIDCTSHGVPGAFVTMLVKAIERQIVAKILNSDEEVSPAKILSIFNQSMKHLLKQETKDAKSNAGFDGGILYIDKRRKILRFAGAETPLFYFDKENNLQTIKGSRQGIGYIKSDPDYLFKEHELKFEDINGIYLTTDGYLDQNGGEKGFCFSKSRFKNILMDNYNKPFKEQKDILIKELSNYQGLEERNDDVTVVGIKI